jgi:hypothetical protein
MMTEEEIVRETAAFYNSKNRATVENIEDGCLRPSITCEYITSDNKMCAVGRCLTKKGLERVMKNCSVYNVSDIDEVFGLDKLLKKKYHGHPVMFWSKLQRLHDNNTIWDENGITKHGKREVAIVFKLKL